MTGPERTAQETTTPRFTPVPRIIVDTSASDATLGPSSEKRPPRPQNAWILYRAWALPKLLEKRPDLKGRPQSILSKLLGDQWARETNDIRMFFERQALKTKEQHARLYPGYVFKPQKKEEKERERYLQKQKKAQVKEASKLRKEIAKALMSHNHLTTAFLSEPVDSTNSSPVPLHFRMSKDQELLTKVTPKRDLGPSPAMSLCPSLCGSPTSKNVCPPVLTPPAPPAVVPQAESSPTLPELDQGPSDSESTSTQTPVATPDNSSVSAPEPTVAQPAANPSDGSFYEFFASTEISAPINTFTQEEQIEIAPASHNNDNYTGELFGLGNSSTFLEDQYRWDTCFSHDPSLAGPSQAQEPAAQCLSSLELQPDIDIYGSFFNGESSAMVNSYNNIAASCDLQTYNAASGLPSPPDSTASISPTEGSNHGLGNTLIVPNISILDLKNPDMPGLTSSPADCSWEQNYNNPFAYNNTLGYGDSLYLCDNETASGPSTVTQPLSPVSVDTLSTGVHSDENYAGQYAVNPYIPRDNGMQGRENFWY